MKVRVMRRREEIEDDEDERPRNRGLWAAHYVFLALGVLGLGYYGYVQADTWAYQDYENWSLDQALRGEPATKFEYVRHLLHSYRDEGGVPEEAVEKPQLPPWVDAGTPESGETATSASTGRDSASVSRSEPAPKNLRVAVRETGLIGRIVAPRLNISAIVREGTDTKTLRRAVGHVKGTALPGEIGNVALAAHRDTFFRGLRDVKKGDRIEVQTVGGKYIYEVDSLKIVTPKQVEVLAASAEPVLTLVTCYPFNYVGSAPKRFIVRAVQVSKPTSAAQQGS